MFPKLPGQVMQHLECGETGLVPLNRLFSPQTINQVHLVSEKSGARQGTRFLAQRRADIANMTAQPTMGGIGIQTGMPKQ